MEIFKGMRDFEREKDDSSVSITMTKYNLNFCILRRILIFRNKIQKIYFKCELSTRIEENSVVKYLILYKFSQFCSKLNLQKHSILLRIVRYFEFFFIITLICRSVKYLLSKEPKEIYREIIIPPLSKGKGS